MMPQQKTVFPATSSDLRPQTGKEEEDRQDHFSERKRHGHRPEVHLTNPNLAGKLQLACWLHFVLLFYVTFRHYVLVVSGA